MLARLLTFALTLGLPIAATAQDTKPEPPKSKPADAPASKGEDDGPEINPADFVYTTDEAIELFLARIRRNPNDDVSYQRLGEAYERKAEATGDLALYEKAEEALRKSLELFPQNHRAEVSLAAVLCSRHKFAEGLERARRCLKRKPKDIDALATAGDALLETGHYAEAEAAYQSLLAITKAPAVLSRLANLADQKGRADEALALMARAVESTRSAGGTDKDAGWFLSRQAEIALNAGRVAEAERLYAGVPEGIDAYHDATAGLARIRAMQGRLPEAITLYEKAVAIGPDPHMLAALGDLHVKDGHPEKAAPLFDRLLAITDGKNEYLRIRSLFLSDHSRDLPQALALAEKDYADRKDVYGGDALAWALHKNGRSAEARKVLDEALKLGTKDALLDFHAGMIRLATGDRDGAREFLRRALDRNPQFSPLHADEARKALDGLGRP